MSRSTGTASSRWLPEPAVPPPECQTGSAARERSSRRCPVPEELLNALQGMTAEQIRELIETSVHAGEVRDAEGLAAYLEAQANAGQ